MEYIYGSLLLYYAKQEISEENLVRVLKAAGIKPDEIKVKTLIAALKEINIEEAIKSAPLAPAVPYAPAAAPPPPAPAAKAEEKAEKKEEEKKGPSEEEIASSLASLF
jgi:large subunit ribosomal protein L12